MRLRYSGHNTAGGGDEKTWRVIMLVIALAMVLIAAASAAVLIDATRSMLPSVNRAVPVTVVTQIPMQRTRATSPDARDDAARRAYGLIASLPTEPRHRAEFEL
jgi:hypothetical protein